MIIMPAKKPIHHKKTTDAHHHQHVRLHRSKKKHQATLIDKLVYIAGPLTPVAIAPTAYAVWFGDAARGIELSTWVILSCTSLVMACYAVSHRARPLVLTYIPLFLLNISVVVGVLVKT